MICRIVTSAPDSHHWTATEDGEVIAWSINYKSAIACGRAMRKFFKAAAYVVFEHYSKPRATP